MSDGFGDQDSNALFGVFGDELSTELGEEISIPFPDLNVLQRRLGYNFENIELLAPLGGGDRIGERDGRLAAAHQSDQRHRAAQRILYVSRRQRIS